MTEDQKTKTSPNFFRLKMTAARIRITQIFKGFAFQQIAASKIQSAQSVNWLSRRKLSTRESWDFIDLTPALYDKVCSETLDGLCDYFDELVEKETHLDNSDVAYGDGVLTVKLGDPYGTYVINRQTPNKQIWLSSPTSGPKRYDFLGSENASIGTWIYKHTGQSLHELLQREIKDIIRRDVDFYKLPYAGA